ncbi:LacI family DNA-binding transcriptional regulator [Streptomyces sp. NPDC002580]|uniref:LacI family DNA-binding transcriptional regulator n=1 Tax=Streptomyces sp. NPDC002580 TaxID=3364653 RepID=UPI0036A1548B
MATMADVARRAGVSIATVSHVLNDTRPVLPGTRQAVLDAVDELGYTPNTLARSLVTSRTRSIGFAVPATGDPYFTELLQGVEAGALEHGYSLLVSDPHDDPEHELEVARVLHERRVDGMIIAPSATPDALLRHLGRHDVPTVLLDRIVEPPAGSGFRHDQVCAENTGPMASLVTHLAERGHRRIGLVAGLPGLGTTAERITGYRHGLAGAGLPYDERLVALGGSRAETAEEAAHRLLDLGAPPGALVTADHTMTVGVLRALRARGLSVPGDVALCCFGDFSWAELFTPRLTVIARPGREIGAKAVRLLLERLASPRRASRTVRLPSAFVHRTSCGCPEDRARPGTPESPRKGTAS